MNGKYLASMEEELARSRFSLDYAYGGLMSKDDNLRGFPSTSSAVTFMTDEVPSLSQPPTLPKVTVSHEMGGSLIEYHNFSSGSTFLQERHRELHSQNRCLEYMQDNKPDYATFRSIRSHSLTPSIGYHQSVSDPGSNIWGGPPPKIRSNSITFGVRDARFNADMDSEATAPEGMGDLRDWMKSLRLHKYTDRLLNHSYEELLALTDNDLERLMFTDGAKGKFLKQISLIKERPVRIKELKQQLEEISELKDLLLVLPELEKLILMPLKPTHKLFLPKPVSASTLTSAVTSLCRQELRHDSESDSGTEMVEEPADDIPQETFELLEKTFSIIICKQHDDSDRDRVVLHFFRLLDRRCLKKEAFNSQQKQWFQTWLKRMDQVWDITKSSSSDCSGLEASRKYERKSPREFPFRRSSLQPSMLSGAMSLGQFSRPPFGVQQHNSLFGGAGVHGQPCVTMPSGPCLSLFQDRHHEVSEGSVAAFQRRSVPDINPPNLCPQIKRNSYQGDHRMPPLVDSEVLPNVFDYQRGLGLSFSSSLSSGSRRASTMSTSSWDSGFSRRSSTMSSSCGDNSRRNSSITEDNHNFMPSPADRRDSSGFLSVDSAVRKGSFSHARLNPGSVSSGCVSDEGSTDSLEHDLHKLSLAVTEQALLE